MRQVPIWLGDVVEVEFCTEEDYYENYRILKEKLMTEFADLLEVRGNPYGMPRRSAFEVLWRCNLTIIIQKCIRTLSRRGEDLQEELWSKFASGEPSTVDATFAVTEVVVYDLEQIFKKYGIHKGRYVERFPPTIEEMDYYRDLAEENERMRMSKKRRWPSNHKRVTLGVKPHV